uniref:Uncharacterized protein n=1 Tax=Moniliophthora roreri TaxID=221103 RepID=A0A0W0FJD0_MONRR
MPALSRVLGAFLPPVMPSPIVWAFVVHPDIFSIAAILRGDLIVDAKSDRSRVKVGSPQVMATTTFAVKRLDAGVIRYCTRNHLAQHHYRTDITHRSLSNSMGQIQFKTVIHDLTQSLLIFSECVFVHTSPRLNHLSGVRCKMVYPFVSSKPFPGLFVELKLASCTPSTTSSTPYTSSPCRRALFGLSTITDGNGVGFWKLWEGAATGGFGRDL